MSHKLPQTARRMQNTGSMEPTSFLFYTFATILLAASVAVITVKNPVHAALFLILSFFSASAIWILLGAEFLALTLVLVYVGAVMVLFLFVIMMARLDLEELKKNFVAHLSVALPVGVMVFSFFERNTKLEFAKSSVKARENQSWQNCRLKHTCKRIR